MGRRQLPLVVLASAALLWPGFAAADARPSEPSVIRVSGSASVEVEPDRAVMRFGVETQDLTAAGALEHNSRLMDVVVTAIRSAGVEPGQVSTARLTINPVYEHRQSPETGGGRTPVLSGYRVGNVVTVDTDRTDRAAAIIDAAVSAGANRLESVQFALSRERRVELQEGLIEAAVRNARSRAEQALAPLGQVIDGVHLVQLGGDYFPSPYAAEGMRMDAAMSAPPVFSGEQSVEVTVNVAFLIRAEVP